MTDDAPKQTEDRERKSADKKPTPSVASKNLLAWQTTHMANERTFLAWTRTSIALLTFGFVVERFDLFLRHLIPLTTGKLTPIVSSHRMVYLSLFSFALAGLATVVSGIRFLSVRRHVNQGEARFSVMPDILVIISVGVIAVIVILLSLPRLHDIGVTLP